MLGDPRVVWQLTIATGPKPPKQQGSRTSMACETCANSAVGQLSWMSICIHGSLLCSELQVLKPRLKERREGKARGGPWPLSSTDGQCSPWNGLMLGINERCVFLRDVVKEEIEKEGSNLITLSKASNTCLMFPHIWWDLHSLSLLQKLSWLVLTP